MNKYTTVGYFLDDPESPIVGHVEADDIAGAIYAGEVSARKSTDTKDVVFVNTFVLEGHCKVLSTWAG